MPLPGKGFVRAQDAKAGTRRIVVSFDPETFDQIRDRAVRNGQTFAASVRDLVEFGLMDEDQ